jgi:hypothetical protein
VSGDAIDGDLNLVDMGAAATCTSDAACDDGNACTEDRCAEGNCAHPPLAIGVACPGPHPGCTLAACDGQGTCAPTGQIKPGQCFINETCVVAGAAIAPGSCLVCDAGQPTQGTAAAPGAACNDGDACTVGDQCGLGGGCKGLAAPCNDGNACTTDSCDPAIGCQHLPLNATACDDGNVCTTLDTCKGGSCVGLGKLDCGDGKACTDDACDPFVGCKSKPLNGTACVFDIDPCTQDVCVAGVCQQVALAAVCTINGVCVPAGQKSDGNDCLICNLANPNSWTPLDKVPCSDGNACTAGDHCGGGFCVGTPALCDDKNSCTQDSCNPTNGCVYLPMAGTCTDGNACTENDHCVQTGACVGTPLTTADCNDNNPCTDDSCNAAVGCTHKPNHAKCSDDDPCTVKDFCNAGSCISGGVVCPCTDDGLCDDGNPCTVDACGNTQGCSNLPAEATACDDNDACSVADVCLSGVCTGLQVDCDDGNPCTFDGCVAETGCTVQVMPDVPCDDGNACTTGDACIDGNCAGTGKNCDDGKPCSDDSCDPTSGTCLHSQSFDGTPCTDDGKPCTVDQCWQGGCDHGVLKKSDCLIQGLCVAGGSLDATGCKTCTPSVSQTAWTTKLGQPCSDGDACTAPDLCGADGLCAGVDKDCDDKNPCTFDDCDSKKGCQHYFWAIPCDDGKPCTVNDGCIQGFCTGAPNLCDDGNPCTADGCLPAKGCAHTTLSQAACPDDGLACTSDLCNEGQCTHAAIPGACIIDKLCRADGDSKPGDPCLACQVIYNASAWTPKSGGACNDGNPCTTGDTCLAGACLGATSGACNDGNPCTIDSCALLTGCSHSPAPGPCSDGNVCTVGDTCLGGTCVAGSPKLCGDGGPGTCTAGVCDPDFGCAVVSTCGALHECVAGTCVTLGATLVPLVDAVAPQPLQPELRWQESHTGLTGKIPQLWLVAQSRPCTAGQTSGLVAAVMEPGAEDPTLLPWQAPAASCLEQPALSAHPATFDHLVLSWLETGASCPAGALRFALLGMDGAATSSTVASGCPSGKALPWRPEPLWLAGPGANTDPATLGGLLVRAGTGGLLGWLGAASTAWSGPGKAMPTAGYLDWKLLPVPTLPSYVQHPVGKLVFDLAQFQKSGDSLAAVSATPVELDGAVGTPQLLAVGAEVPGSEVSFAGVQVAWDPDGARLGVLISGTYQEAGGARGFLALGRAAWGQPPLSNPTVVALFEPGAGYTGDAAVRAFRLTELPGTSDFLLAWVLPTSDEVHLARLQPVTDKSFVVKSNAVLANGFQGHVAAPGVQDGGGLSQLLVAPDGKRYSLAWETAKGIRVLTALLP